MSDEQRKLMMLAYEQEREDERSFWTSTSTLLLSALGVVLLLTAGTSKDNWGLWVAAPFLSAPLLAFYLHQGAIGARRRTYMTALEIELSSGAEGLTVLGESVRPLAGSGYTWTMNTFEPKRAAGLTAAALFLLINSVPFALLGAVFMTAVYRLHHTHPTAYSWTFWGGLAVYIVIIIPGLWMQGTKSQKASWALCDNTP
jgi:uncharacterized BrkB/YihY/UPF0761 family membrane protein